MKGTRIGKKQKESGPFPSRKIATRMAKEVLGQLAKRGADFYVGTHGGEWWYWSESPIENTLLEAERKKLETKAAVIGLNQFVKYDSIPAIMHSLGLHVYEGSVGMVIATQPMTKSAQHKLVRSFKETQDVPRPKKKKKLEEGEAEKGEGFIAINHDLGSSIVSALISLGLRVYKTSKGHVVAKRELTEAERKRAKSAAFDMKELLKAVNDVLNMHAMPTEPKTYQDNTGAMADLRKVYREVV